MKINYAPEFRDEIDSIAEYLRKWNFNLRIIRDIYDEIEQKFVGKSIVGTVYSGHIRKVTILKKNVVYFEVRNDVVEILHIKAGRQDKTPRIL
ncbi:hypothetical protein FACS189431_3150 [Alphaproteobacteria bacterium]|nr:hypothetical protein FACS189431_3150 [Alphaproteobacteria bacterium]